MDFKFEKSNYKDINEYIENNKNNDDVLNYVKIKKEINLIKQNIDKRVKKVHEDRRHIDDDFVHYRRCYVQRR